MTGRVVVDVGGTAMVKPDRMFATVIQMGLNNILVLSPLSVSSIS